MLIGEAVCGGIGIGTAYRAETSAEGFYRIGIGRRQVARELEQFRIAVRRSSEQLLETRERFEKLVGREHAHIIEAHLLILRDQAFLSQIERRISQQLQSPERAVREASEQWLSLYRSLDDPFFRERGSDLEEVADRLVANLMDLVPGRRVELPRDLVLIAPELGVSALADYSLERIRGLVLTKAGRTSHTAIIARSYQIPVVAGIPDVCSQIGTGERIVVDGERGLVHVSPSSRTALYYRRGIVSFKKRTEDSLKDQRPVTTQDGHRVHLYLNAAPGADSEDPQPLIHGADGVGLFRSEYLYVRNKDRFLDEDSQFEVYRQLAETVGDKPAIIRTLDVGGGIACANGASHGDMALGLRGIRLSLRCPEVFRTQIRAILRAGVHGNLRVVFPMVTNVEEVRQGKELIRRAREELLDRGIACVQSLPLGVMIEVPAAVLTLESIAREVDFLAVGSNDLIQYTLAAGRTDDQVAYLFNPLQPAILGSLFRIANVSRELGKPAWVCGEIAGHPLFAYLLVGMGFEHLSMGRFAIPHIRRLFRRVTRAAAEETVRQLMTLSTVGEVEEFLAGEISGLNLEPERV